MLNPDLMRIFISVCETKSFTMTSQAMNIQKSSVSASIKKIESITGTKLLQRTTRKVTITTDGEQFYKRCKSIICEFEEIETMFKKGDEISGKIRVDMAIPVAINAIIPNLNNFFKLHPNIELELSSSDHKVDLVSEGYDFIIRSGSMNDSTLIAKKIGHYNIINCASPSYLEDHGVPKNIKELESHHSINYSQNLGQSKTGFEYFDGNKYKYQKTKQWISVNSSGSFISACKSGLGIAQIPLTNNVREYIKLGKLKEILKDYKSEPMELYFLYPDGKLLSKRVRYFMDWMETHLKQYLMD